MLETGQPYRPTPFPIQPRVIAYSDLLEKLDQSEAQLQAAYARAHRQLMALVLMAVLAPFLIILAVAALLS